MSTVPALSAISKAASRGSSRRISRSRHISRAALNASTQACSKVSNSAPSTSSAQFSSGAALADHVGEDSEEHHGGMDNGAMVILTLKVSPNQTVD